MVRGRVARGSRRRAIGAVDSSEASLESHSTQISLLPPPCCMDTISA